MDKSSKETIGIRIVLSVAAEGIKKWLTQSRMYVVALSIFIFSWTQIKDIRASLAEQNLGMSYSFSTFLFSAFICTLFLYLSVILMFCDAPFIDRQQLFVIVRTGKRNWFLGKILYIVFAGIIFTVCVNLVCWIELFPYIGFGSSWGDMALQIVRNTGDIKGNFSLTERTLEMFSPGEAFALQFFIVLSTSIFLGLLIFFINLHKSRTYGSVAALAVVLISSVLQFASNYKNVLQYVSVVSWGNLSIYSRGAGTIPLSYVVTFLILGNVLLIIGILLSSKKCSIEWMEE